MEVDGLFVVTWGGGGLVHGVDFNVEVGLFVIAYVVFV